MEDLHEGMYIPESNPDGMDGHAEASLDRTKAAYPTECKAMFLPMACLRGCVCVVRQAYRLVLAFHCFRQGLKPVRRQRKFKVGRPLLAGEQTVTNRKLQPVLDVRRRTSGQRGMVFNMI